MADAGRELTHDNLRRTRVRQFDLLDAQRCLFLRQYHDVRARTHVLVSPQMITDRQSIDRALRIAQRIRRQRNRFNAAYCSSMIVLASLISPSSIIARAWSNGSSQHFDVLFVDTPAGSHPVLR